MISRLKNISKNYSNCLIYSYETQIHELKTGITKLE